MAQCTEAQSMFLTYCHTAFLLILYIINLTNDLILQKLHNKAPLSHVQNLMAKDYQEILIPVVEVALLTKRTICYHPEVSAARITEVARTVTAE